jgi:hypothetical protein
MTAIVSRLRVIVALGTIAGLLLSQTLWLSVRTHPLAPVWDFLRPVPPPFDYLALAAMLGLLVWIAIASRPALPVAVFVVLVIAYAACDQSRWQPWLYQYLFMLVALARRDGPLDTCRLIVAAIYFWSGAHKIRSLRGTRCLGCWAGCRTPRFWDTLRRLPKWRSRWDC